MIYVTEKSEVKCRQRKTFILSASMCPLEMEIGALKHPLSTVLRMTSAFFAIFPRSQHPLLAWLYGPGVLVADLY
jgi:hypothetical protein